MILKFNCPNPRCKAQIEVDEDIEYDFDGTPLTEIDLHEVQDFSMFVPLACFSCDHIFSQNEIAKISRDFEKQVKNFKLDEDENEIC